MICVRGVLALLYIILDTVNTLVATLRSHLKFLFSCGVVMCSSGFKTHTWIYC